MKAKITVREMENIRRKVIKVGYCYLQWLLQHKSADLYCAGKTSWKCDIYLIDNDTAIVTGYDTGGLKRGSHVPYYVCKKYDEEAKNEILCSNDYVYESRIKAANARVERFIADVLNNVSE